MNRVERFAGLGSATLIYGAEVCYMLLVCFDCVDENKSHVYRDPDLGSQDEVVYRLWEPGAHDVAEVAGCRSAYSSKA
jgi:hypothetical protein